MVLSGLLEKPACDGPCVRMQNCCSTQVLGPVWMYSPVPHPATGARDAPVGPATPVPVHVPSPLVTYHDERAQLAQKSEGCMASIGQLKYAFTVTVLEIPATSVREKSE